MYLLAIINLQFSQLYLRRLAWVLRIQPVVPVEVGSVEPQQGLWGRAVGHMPHKPFLPQLGRRSLCMLLSSSGGLSGMRVSVAS